MVAGEPKFSFIDRNEWPPIQLKLGRECTVLISRTYIKMSRIWRLVLNPFEAASISYPSILPLLDSDRLDQNAV